MKFSLRFKEEIVLYTSILKSRDITPTKVHLVKSYGFSSSHVCMWELEYKKSRALKDWCFWTMVLKKTLESSLNGKEIKLEILKIISPEYSLERLMLKLKFQYFGLDAKIIIGKDPDAGKVWRQEEKGTTEDEMAGWHHWFDGHESEQTLEVGDGQGSLACCSP